MSSTLPASIALRVLLSGAVLSSDWKVSISPNTEAVSRQRERRIGHQGTLPRRQHLVHAMSQLVRERHDVPYFALIIQQQVRVRRRHRGMGEGARRLAGARRGVDPAGAEEFAAD